MSTTTTGRGTRTGGGAVAPTLRRASWFSAAELPAAGWAATAAGVLALLLTGAGCADLLLS